MTNTIKVYFLFLLIICFFTTISSLNFPNLFSSKADNVKVLRNKILELAKKTKRGLVESPSEKENMRTMFESLEKLNNSKKTLSNPSLNAVWSLEYTTSDSILGRGGSERIGPILQTINARDLKAENSEVVNYFGLFKIKRFDNIIFIF